MTVRSNSAYGFFLPDLFSVFQRGQRCAATAHLSLMRPLFIVVQQPLVEIRLQALQVAVQLLPKGHLIKLVQDRFVEAFADVVGLR